MTSEKNRRDPGYHTTLPDCGCDRCVAFRITSVHKATERGEELNYSVHSFHWVELQFVARMAASPAGGACTVLFALYDVVRCRKEDIGRLLGQAEVMPRSERTETGFIVHDAPDVTGGVKWDGCSDFRGVDVREDGVLPSNIHCCDGRLYEMGEALRRAQKEATRLMARAGKLIDIHDDHDLDQAYPELGEET